MAIAGTQFTMAKGEPWSAAVPRRFWPDALVTEMEDALHKAEEDPTGYLWSPKKWDAEFGDRRNELVYIGREMDEEAARALLDKCLLTDEEMASGVDSWLTMADPFMDGERVYAGEPYSKDWRWGEPDGSTQPNGIGTALRRLADTA